MADVRIEQVYNCSEDTLWNKLWFEEEYNRRMFTEGLHFPAYQQVKFEETDSEIRRSVEVTPELGPMPGPLKKLIGEGLGYREDAVFDKQTRRYKLKITPNKLSDKVTISGEIWAEPKGEGKVNRIFTCSINAKIFGVGGMLEKKTIEDMQKSYAAAAQWTNKYLEEKGLAGT